MKKTIFLVKRRLISFVYAFSGLKRLMKEPNAWIHLFASVLVIFLSIYYKIDRIETMFIGLSISLVFSAELFNTSIEEISNFICKEKNEHIKIIKDLAAAGVLVCAIFSFFVAFIIFYPKILS